MRNERRTVPKYQAPIGQTVRPETELRQLPAPEPEPSADPPEKPPKRQRKPPADKPPADGTTTIGVRLERVLVAKLDRLRNRPPNPPVTRAAFLRWLLEREPE